MIKKILKSKNKKELILNYFGYIESYSQCCEDKILYNHINKDKGIYVDIGANHPTKLNNFYLFYKRGWTGINVEPNLFIYKKLCKKRAHDINLNIGIGNGEKMNFYIIDNHVLSTFDKKTADSYISMGHKIIDKKNVQTQTLASVLDTYLNGKEIDILSVDVEGFDMYVLETNNWNKYKPSYIILETLEYKNDGTGKKLNTIFDEYLFNKGYEKLADTHINTIYKLT